MKRILSFSLLAAALAVAVTGCLKDKGFDNHTYGINDPDTQPPGVGFPLGGKPKNDVGLDLSSSPQVINGLAFVNLESGNPASSDVHVTLSNNSTALVGAYNTANGTNIQVLPSATWSVPTALTIPAGGRNIEVPITVSTTAALNANLQYAIGLTITAVDGGYKIADNLKNLFIVISVKNKYDGKYTMVGRFYHPSVEPTFQQHVTFFVECHTTGPNSVDIYWPLIPGYNTPLSSGGLPACCFTNQTLGLQINPATNVVTCVNSHPSAGISYSQITSSGSFGFPVFNPSMWDDVNKRFNISFGYSLTGGTVVAGVSRAWIETLTRTGPR
ncbi:MAG: DUF1735 domain-containing protein [Sphingobacteriales bacterium]|nr:DUF1735 domain-containing protein [Sphingobacteriales bacterium]